jgi:pimeloyl-ACP methyl ester carboxylesterase
VSLADVGLSSGRPVLLYLGLGCVRYIIGLYDEMAEALGIRLLCVDRWGLGRTTDVPSEKRGMLEWAGVVEEVMDHLGIDDFGVIAHSAGAPYALASALKLSDRIHGSVHLLAPWVSQSVDGGEFHLLRCGLELHKRTPIYSRLQMAQVHSCKSDQDRADC